MQTLCAVVAFNVGMENFIANIFLTFEAQKLAGLSEIWNTGHIPSIDG
jgi:hypothetical protein